MGQYSTPRSLTDPGDKPDRETTDLAGALLAALTRMAGRSLRRQADLAAAMHGAGLSADHLRVRAALRLLLAQGWITVLVPLSDGGLLLGIADRPVQAAGPSSPWLPLDEAEPEPSGTAGAR